MNETIAVISAITALLAVLLSPLVAVWIAQKQARVSVLSGNRQGWINTLRDSVAEYIAVLSFIHFSDWNKRPAEELDEKIERALFLESKIKLMVNPEEEDHQRLIDLLIDGRRTAVRPGSERAAESTSRWIDVHKNLVPLTQVILKREWVRVKNTQ